MNGNVNPLAGKTVLVTGAAGFIGANLVRSLLGVKANVIGVVQSTSDLWRLDGVSDSIKVVECDLSQWASYQTLPQDVDYIFHLAAVGVTDTAVNAHDVARGNIMAMLNVLEQARRSGGARVIYTGSCFEYGSGEGFRETDLPSPTSVYASAKAAAGVLAQGYCSTFGLDVVTLRLFTAYGPWEDPRRLIPYTIQCALNGREIALTEGKQTRDYVYVGDVVRALTSAAIAPAAAGEILNICTGVATSVSEVVRTILTLCQVPSSQAHFGAIAARPRDVTACSGIGEKAATILRLRPEVSLNEGLRHSVKWIRSKQASRPQHQITGR